MTADSHYGGFPRYTGPEPGPRKLRVEVDRSWERFANCLGVDPDVMFPERGDMAGWRQARAICAACVARKACLDAHLDEVHGCFGGTSPKERQEIRLRRRSA